MDQQQRISLNTRVRFRELGEEGVVVQMDSGRVVVVNQVGLRIIQLLSDSRSMDELVTTIHTEFEVTRENAHEDIVVFLDDLDDEIILEQRTGMGVQT